MSCPTDPAPAYVPPKRKATIAVRAAREMMSRAQDDVSRGALENAVFGLVGALKMALDAVDELVHEMPPDPPDPNDGEMP